MAIPVVTADEMQRLEQLAYGEGADVEQFMRRAGAGVAERLLEWIPTVSQSQQITFLCGKGNNGGDGYVAALQLLEEGYQVEIVEPLGEEGLSPLCEQMRSLFYAGGGQRSETLTGEGVIVDALFGTGFHGEIRAPLVELVHQVNSSRRPVLSIDIPSGLEGSSGEAAAVAIRAWETVYLGLPKVGFFSSAGWPLVGHLYRVDFGLDERYLNAAQACSFLFEEADSFPLLPTMQRTQHKYQSGVAAGLAGSVGMPGAAALAALTVLRMGAGMSRLLHPSGMEAELAGMAAEVVRIPYSWEERDKVLAEFEKAEGIYLGPGLGRGADQRKLLTWLLKELKKSVVIDADALSIIAEEGLSPPRGAILTPHQGEASRLLGGRTIQEYVDTYDVLWVEKGAPTRLYQKASVPYQFSVGDPGMATAGTGDVLTGMIAGLLARGLQPQEAALLAVQMHGLAGEEAAIRVGSDAMIASDVIEELPDVWLSLRGCG